VGRRGAAGMATMAMAIALLGVLWQLTVLAIPLLCITYFLPRGARSAERGIAIVSGPSVRPSVCDVELPWACRLG